MTADTGDDEVGPDESPGDSDADDGNSGESPGDSDADVDALRRRIAELEDHLADLDRQMATDDEMRAAREGIESVREDLDALETRIDERTVDREDFEAELRRYVRRRIRRGHATGWGPYLVLLYGTVMTVGAFYYLGDRWAVLAMVVIWLSTLGLYVFAVIVGSMLAAGRRLAGLGGLVGKLR